MVELATQEAMSHLGSTLKHLVAVMADNYNLDPPFLFYELEISDGFGRLAILHI